jgi:hypothetical protein
MQFIITDGKKKHTVSAKDVKDVTLWWLKQYPKSGTDTLHVKSVEEKKTDA